VDNWDNDDMIAQAGNASHEVRTWVAAYAALASAGPYRMTGRYYRPIPEWIAGFAVATAITA
jgi:2,3-dihydroxyphenylpropionate 1,2-dioxygenase